MLSTAISITARAFEDKKDKGGKAYILHCLHVMNQMDQNDEELMCIAVMHDLLEDTDRNAKELFIEGFSERVVNGVEACTHLLNESYENYIKRVSLNEDARKVKLADLKHNSDITRMKGLRKKDFDRLEKYHRAFVYLSGV